MLDAQAALSAAGIAGYRGAFRPLPGQESPPDTYCAYTYTRTPAAGWDDKQRDETIRAFLHLFSQSDPSAAQEALRAAMRAEGFSLLRENEGYAAEAEDYEVISEWEGTRWAWYSA